MRQKKQKQNTATCRKTQPELLTWKRFQEVREEREHKRTNAFHPRLVLFFRAMRYLIKNLLPSPPCAVCGARGSSSCAASFIYFKKVCFPLRTVGSNLWYESSELLICPPEKRSWKKEKKVAPPAQGRKTFCGLIKMAVKLCHGL